MRENDFHQDPFLDLVITKVKLAERASLLGRIVQGYIQRLEYFPFGLAMFTDLQLRILKEMLRRTPETCLHIDATGKFCR